MLKTLEQDQMWLVTQPDHAQVSGYLAAHWGNDDFARPGYFASSPDSERLRAETVFGIAEHDNGWWEWDATPELADVDGFPSGLSDVLKNQQEGMNRWRLGVSPPLQLKPRLREPPHQQPCLLVICCQNSS